MNTKRSSSLAAKAAAVNNSSLKDRRVLRRMSFSTFEEEYLPDGWGVVGGISSVDGSATLSISFEEDGEEKVVFFSNEVKNLIAKGQLDYQQTTVCWYAPTDNEGEFVQLQRRAEQVDGRDIKALAALLAKKRRG